MSEACSDACAAGPRPPRRRRPPRCSDVSEAIAEPMPGTAKAARLFIAVEHTAGWSRDILDGGVFGDELTENIDAWLKERGAALQLIRKPGRLGQIACAGVTVFIAHCPPDTPTPDGHAGAWMETLTVADIAELLELDVRLGRPTPGARRVHHPLLLVCTHGKRDVCCAVKGRPTAAHVAATYPGLCWETSHSKGHRFAPTMILLPGNFSYGRISREAAVAVLENAAGGWLTQDGCRGRGTWQPRAQVAELAAREHHGWWGLDEVTGVEDPGGDARVVVTHASGATCTVRLEPTVTEGVISSCGDAPKPQKGWRATAVSELS